MKVAFRVDVSPAIGTGHFMRCLALADALRDRGARVRFLSRGLTGAFLGSLADRRHELCALAPPSDDRVEGDLGHSHWLGVSQDVDARDSSAALSSDAWDWLVVDHYALDARWESALRSRADRVLAIDDLADRQHDCDVLLDQNLHREAEQRYAGLVPKHCLMLLGPRHALLRGEFRATRGSARTGPVRRVLVSFGGADTINRTGLAIEALVGSGRRLEVDVVVGTHHGALADIRAACARAGFACHEQTSQMAALMAAADLAIGAAGITMWERCCMGVPSLTMAVAANQEPVVRGAALHGLVYAPTDAASSESLGLHLRALLDNGLLREMLSRNGMEAVDGRGVDRVAQVLDQGAITIRVATAQDAPSLFEWRNHESVRRASRSPEPIPWADHLAWLDSVLSNPNRRLLIGEREGSPVGVVRFDIHDDRAEVSIYRVPEAGHGRAAALLLAAEAWLQSAYPAVALLTADVLQENQRSHHLFQSTGYHEHSSVYRKTLRAV